MNNLNLKNITENFIDTFLKAGKVAKQISEQGVKIKIKADKSPVTDGDLAVDELLRNKINKNISIVIGGKGSPCNISGISYFQSFNKYEFIIIKRKSNGLSSSS